ncbi:MFS transporter [Hymenobacter qilianensis]|uniref:MFS transporter n=2 Tax=Hymenobacter qilianensis TaxID=1385715 RepID=A0ACB5PV75_9BACT|nr:peptide MFS transporter [Hymenobacter qilianensis]QNP51479.1 peptide MFS transporter [Hymenobacter qilianensis]GGF74814.1 MFS transporter [Hymenobacter qilianensis]
MQSASVVPDQPPVAAQQGHPKALYLLFFTELWERFSYYGMRGLLTLYLTKTILAGGLEVPAATATLIYGYFTGFVYFTPIIGGWIADRFIGQRRAILIGGTLMALGQFSLFSTTPGSPAVAFGLPLTTCLGLLLLIIGNGFFKPNISTLVGQLYEQGDPRRDSAFTIFYMGINIGAFLAPLVCGYFAEDLFATKTVVDGVEQVSNYGFRYGFLAAGLGMVLGQIIFNLFAPRLLGPIGLAPVKVVKDKNAPKETLSKEETDRMAVIFIITLFVVFFWAGFEQAGSSLTLYTDSYIDREVFGYLIPTSWFQSVNPLFIVALAPIVASIWLSLGRKGKDLSIPVKMGLGMVLLGMGFLFMVGAVMERGGDVSDTTVKASILWLLATYFFHTIGELCLSPIGLSMVTRLAPISYTSALMGVWFLAPFVAQIAGGYIAAYVEELGALKVFGLIAGFVILAGLILIAIAKKLFHMMHGRGN